MSELYTYRKYLHLTRLLLLLYALFALCGLRLKTQLMSAVAVCSVRGVHCALPLLRSVCSAQKYRI
eukprot:scaffold13851_cov124-Isochrysis_galbana.AAC.5